MIKTATSAQVHSAMVAEMAKDMREGIVILDRVNTIEVVNGAALAILGLPADARLTGKHISIVQTANETFNELSRYLVTGLKRGGDLKPNDRFSVRTFREHPDADAYTIIILHETERRGLDCEKVDAHTRSLEQTNKELDQFAHIVSHDLKAPLRAISNLSVWLEEDLGASLSGENRDNFIKLRGRVLRMEALINGILEYSKVGREQVENETVDVLKIVTEVLELLAPPSHIKIEIGPRMPVMQAPRVMLLQVFSNLISNAIKYNNKAEGLVNICVTERDNFFEFIVQDNGPGIPPQYHEKIFTIFQTLQARDKFESTGIGLTIVRRILTARGGDIRVESTPGEGSKFIFTWPT